LSSDILANRFARLQQGSSSVVTSKSRPFRISTIEPSRSIGIFKKCHRRIGTTRPMQLDLQQKPQYIAVRIALPGHANLSNR
jgi:hypothetical protein